MRNLWPTVFVIACGGSQGEVADPGPPPVYEAPASVRPAETSSASAIPSAVPEAPPKAEAGEEWSVEQGSAKGVDFSNEQNQKLQLDTLGWTSFKRKSKPLGDARMASANVSFATVSANGAAASDVLCALPPWGASPKDPLTMASVMIPLVAADALPAAALAKSRPALLACGKGKPVRVEWTFAESKLVSAKAEAMDAQGSACVNGVLAKTFMLGSGVCAATLTP